ncbi:hypothetical protein [Caproiciproducens galactitolivorans]|uniref:Uncharacterized protein n=1 Tax=Caproiciproducens galactitolivorans TaxID=642589 RepID=A0ABT4BW22_9FIRM|nr:hypothetical protein [Caproiciproducens galactitolivorans]MCY1715089.1 hypothetical protein [Caproiciproducens galactitolivorans]
MDIENVMERFALMADLSDKAAAKYKPFCEDAMAEIKRRAKDDSAAAQGILCAAAASLALYRWALANACAGEESFSAGDVRVTKSGMNVETARQAWRESVAAAAPYLKDEGFLFERIKK